MGRFIRQISANLWKCLHVRKRHYILTALVILLPITLFAFLGYARSKVSGIGKQVINETTYNEYLFKDQIYERYKWNMHETVLYYAPSDSFTDELIKGVQITMGLRNNDIKEFNDEAELVQFFKENSTQNTVFAVIFDDTTNLETNLKYSIRNYEKYMDWNTNELFTRDYGQYMQGIGSEKYFHKGFIVLEMALGESFIRMQRKTDQLPVTLTMQEFPYPPHTSDMGINSLFMHMLPFVTLFSFLLTCPSTLKNIVEEKDSGIKELMKMMGLPTSVMWLCWFIDAIVINFFSIIFIVLFMKWDWGTDYAPIQYTDGLIFGVFLLLYCCACIAVCFFISTFFQTPNFTTITGILFWIVSYLIPYSIGDNMAYLSILQKASLCLCPNIAMYYGYQAINIYETRGLGVQWSNLFKSASGGSNDLTMGIVMVMFVIDTILLMVVTFYLDSVRPGKHGLPKPWGFPLIYLKDLMKGSIKRINTTQVIPCTDLPNEYTKIESCDCKAGIQIRNLYKKYGNKLAVNNLSIEFYNGEITVLLGHNGAGKSTTMSILTGLVKATKGSVSILDHDLNDSIESVRTLMGICPQHNLFFTDLSVKEQLVFFGKLKAVENIETKVDDLLRMLNLYDKKDQLPGKLSGGMKRKLCLGMAIISNPQVLILDEPTSGLDPKSRREIWDILLNWRKSTNCTILISTHFMEEAEALGQRIAIIDHGNLISYGTPMFLKNEYSTGYILTIIKKPDSGRGNDGNIEEIVTKEISEATKTVNSNDTMCFSLPSTEKHRFPKVLKELESKREELSIDAINISITTLEDVFLRVSNLVKNGGKKSDHHAMNVPPPLLVSKKSPACGQKFWILFRNHWNSVKSMFMKNHLLYIFIAFAIFLLGVLLSIPSAFTYLSDDPKLKMDLNAYGNTIVYFSGDKSNPEISTMMDKYETLINEQKSNAVIVPSVSEALINLGLKNIEEYGQHAIIAAEFNQSTEYGKIVNIMYSNGALHGAPISLNLALNAITKTFANPSSSISLVNEPLTKTDADFAKEMSEIQVGIIWILIIPMALLFFGGCFIIHPFRERITNMKHLIYMTGIKPFCYWLNMFFFDFIFYLIVCGILSLFIFANPIFANMNAFGALLLILFFYGIPMILYVYLFSYRKTIPAGFGTLVMVNLFAGVVLTVVVNVLKMSGEQYYERWGEVLHYFFNLCPQYWLTFTMLLYSRKAVWIYNWDNMEISKKTHTCRFNENPCCGEDRVACDNYKSFTKDILEWSSLLPFLLSALVFFLILVFLDSWYFKKIRMYWLKKFYKNPITPNRLNAGDEVEDHAFVVNSLQKVINSKMIVDDLSFTVKPGDCFGLLGVNGAGKTTSFKMLTGDELASSGTVMIRNSERMNIDTNFDDFLSNIGYCPQFNAINSTLTGRELLTLFANLRKVRNPENIVEQLIQDLDLTEYGDVKSGEYSGGNMRKLSLGIALIGDRQILMMDEPSTGVDPVARRKLWDVLNKLKAEMDENQKKKRCMIFTSHSMDECEALCDYLAIMKAGKIDKYGTIPKLKELYGNGFTVIIKVKLDNCDVDVVDSTNDITNELKSDDTVTKVEREFMDKFTDLGPHLKDKHLSLLHFQLREKKNLSELFEMMENFKKKNTSSVEDYIINMTSLEDIFLNEAK